MFLVVCQDTTQVAILRNSLYLYGVRYSQSNANNIITGQFEPNAFALCHIFKLELVIVEYWSVHNQQKNSGLPICQEYVGE